MKLKRLLAGVLAATAALTLAGCNNNESSGNSSSSSSSTGGNSSTGNNSTSGNSSTGGDSTSDNSSTPAQTGATLYDASKITDGLTLNVLTNRTDLVDSGYLDQMTDAFEQKFNCTVKYEGLTKYNGDVKTRMTTTNYGDVLMIPSNMTPEDKAAKFEPLGSYDELSKKYLWMDQHLCNGQVYGIPHMGSVDGGIVYNKRVWSEAGITELPKTPEDFIADLKKINEHYNGTVIPYLTNFGEADKWPLNQIWALSDSIEGDPEFQTKILTEKSDLLTPGNGYYESMKFMFDLVSTAEVLEEDHMTSGWEASKPAISQGKIGTMIMGSWSVSQFKEILTEEQGGHPEDIGFMPAPFNKDGKQYARSAADYAMAVNINSDAAVKELGKAYIEWFISESTFIKDQQGLSPLIGADMPDYLTDFADCEFFVSSPAPDALQGVFDEIDKESEVGTQNQDAANFKAKIAEAAFKGEGEEAFKAIVDDVNKRWAETRDKNEKYIAYHNANG